MPRAASLVPGLGGCWNSARAYWILPNAGGIGYHRSQLSAELLGGPLDRGTKKLSLPERVSVIGDVSGRVNSTAGHEPYRDCCAPRNAPPEGRWARRGAFPRANGMNARTLTPHERRAEAKGPLQALPEFDSIVKNSSVAEE